ncbi:MAG: GlmU family protein [Cyclobacteriaceae bacterium]
MKIVLVDKPNSWLNLLPFTYTRSISDIRCGILTIAEKWAKISGLEVYKVSESHLATKYPQVDTSNSLLIDSCILPDSDVLESILNLKPGECLAKKDIGVIAINNDKNLSARDCFDSAWSEIEYIGVINKLEFLWNIFQFNGNEIIKDYRLITQGRKSAEIADPYTIVYGKTQVFLEEGVSIKAAILNAEDGPIYLGKNVQVQEGAVIQGPFAMGDNGVINIGAKIRKGTSAGPHCKIGGEVNNAVLFGYTNKAHDGFLGNSVIGEWCNIGADTNTSNLKNNYSEVKVWNYVNERFIGTGSQFCGLMMGDHAKCAINTMFNTGSVVGVAANIFGSGFPRNFVPSFSWGGPGGLKTFQIDKGFEVANAMMERRGLSLTEADKEILTNVFERSAKYRIWEKQALKA